ncbi:hypothetical protein Syun_010243 [Stephania yunnanensis]|uniref:Uncharacterized protein n=1 Tax=Stephania yunnanensis TaxID=152371 RepID=A0AAP0KIA2_9MAGN
MAGRGRRGCRGLPLGGRRGGRGRGSIPAVSIPTARSLEQDTAAASPSPSIPSGRMYHLRRHQGLCLLHTSPHLLRHQ